MRFVVIEIPDNDVADNFVQAVKDGRVIYGVPRSEEGEIAEVNYLGLNDQGEASVPAMYGVPTKFCDCADYEGKGVRTKKYGWYVHAKCAKPRANTSQYPNNLLGPGGLKEKVYTIGFRGDRKSAWGI